jgi:hypothetical protein
VALRRQSSRPHGVAWGPIYLGLLKMLVGSKAAARASTGFGGASPSRQSLIAALQAR